VIAVNLKSGCASWQSYRPRAANTRSAAMSFSSGDAFRIRPTSISFPLARLLTVLLFPLNSAFEKTESSSHGAPPCALSCSPAALAYFTARSYASSGGLQTSLGWCETPLARPNRILPPAALQCQVRTSGQSDALYFLMSIPDGPPTGASALKVIVKKLTMPPALNAAAPGARLPPGEKQSASALLLMPERHCA